MSHFHVAIPPDREPKLNDYEQLVRTEWMTRDEAAEAFKSLPAEIARQTLAFLDQVITGQSLCADRDAQCLAWARQSTAAYLQPTRRAVDQPTDPADRDRRDDRQTDSLNA